MHSYVALLRGINLGKRRLKMERLKALFEEMGFSEVGTFIASGNVVFASKEKDPRKLELKIEKHLEKTLGYDVDTFVRTRSEIAEAAAYEAFPKAGTYHGIYAGFLKEPLSPADAKVFVECGTETDSLHINGSAFYWLCRIPSHESKVWASPKMKGLKIKTMTLRNVTSLRKLAALHPPA